MLMHDMYAEANLLAKLLSFPQVLIGQCLEYLFPLVPSFFHTIKGNTAQYWASYKSPICCLFPQERSQLSNTKPQSKTASR